MNVPANSEVGLVAAMVEAAHGDSKDEQDSDSGATFHRSHARTGMIAYKTASPGTSVEVANGTILSVDGFGTIKVGMDQPGSTTKPDSEDGCRRVCVRTFAEPDIHP